MALLIIILIAWYFSQGGQKMVTTKSVYIVGGKRTPFGKFGGSLASLTPLQLALLPTKALFEQINLNPDVIDQVIFSNVIPSTPDTLYAGRHLALKSGMKISTPGIVINRLCGSGIQAIIDAMRIIKLGEANAILVAGAENMSMAPQLVYGTRFGTRFGSLATRDFLQETLTDSHIQTPMGITAENLAFDYKVNRFESDNYSLNSHTKANEAYKNNLIQNEICSVNVDKINCFKDEHLREEISLDEMAKLKPSFKKDGVVTPGSASGIVDGASAMIIVNEEFLIKHNIKPIAEIIDGHVVAVDPAQMGIGPVPAINGLLNKTSKKISEIELFEINEAFAPQVISCQKALEIDKDKLNVWGGAIALGHPLGATGIKITLTLARQLQHFNKKYGISSACIGGGQGIALLLKKV